MSDIRCCGRCGEPMVFTFEFAGAELVCICGNLEGVFGDRAPATPERQLRHSELTELYDSDSARRRGIDWTPPAHVGEPGVIAPVCSTCGDEPPPGVMLHDGKPPSWFSRKHDGEWQYACSKACIPERESVMPW